MIKIIEVLDEINWNPSVRRQKSQFIPSEKLKEQIRKEVFSKFPELVIDGPNVDIQKDEKYNMTFVLIVWSCWIPTQINNDITFENVKSGIKMQFTDEILEGNPEWFLLSFEESLDKIEEQLEKMKFEFYKNGIDPKQVQPYFQQLPRTTRIVIVPACKIKGGNFQP